MRCKECIYCQRCYNHSWCKKDNPNFDDSEEVSCKDFEWSLPAVKETEVKTENPSTLDMSVSITCRVVESDLLDEILTTLESLNHKQIVKLASLNFKDQDRTETYELEELDLDILIGKIKMVLK